MLATRSEMFVDVPGRWFSAKVLGAICVLFTGRSWGFLRLSGTNFGRGIGRSRCCNEIIREIGSGPGGRPSDSLQAKSGGVRRVLKGAESRVRHRSAAVHDQGCVSQMGAEA